jgi:hypothetical protein
MDVKKSLKVGDKVIMHEWINRNKSTVEVVEVGYFATMWLDPPNNKVWGVIVKYDGDKISSPMREEQFSYDELFKTWHLQLR